MERTPAVQYHRREGELKETNRVCKIIGTDILLLYEAILDLVSLTSIQILSLEVVFAYPF